MLALPSAVHVGVVTAMIGASGVGSISSMVKLLLTADSQASAFVAVIV
jgi:hypothetical protein